MPVEISIIDRYLPFLPSELKAEIALAGNSVEIGKGTTILQEGQYVKVIPIVLEGLIRVFTQVEDRELLLYYIRPSESCVMSFSAIINNDKSKIFAMTEADSSLLLLPSEKMGPWTRLYPRLNDIFFQQYNIRYNELIDTIQHLLFNRLDQRLLNYLREQSRVRSTPFVQVKHREIAQDLGTAREVITRTMRKLETDGKIRQTPEGIMILGTY
ncbi:MAG TPA: Crp/Fnr family transcriptional regulator [Chitinophagaceae bacterium]|nr:Crp/Fnr family transcriptional regulator [Chitinophagaceae bacterium]